VDPALRLISAARFAGARSLRRSALVSNSSTNPMRDSDISGGESFHHWQHRGSPLVAVASNAPIFGSSCTARRHVDLAVFPSVSKQHSTRLANRGGGVAPADEIWKACLNEFKAIDSAAIAKAFVMAYRIAG
jgi:hypothetical protein